MRIENWPHGLKKWTMKIIMKPVVASMELVVDPAAPEELQLACHQDAALAALVEPVAQRSLALEIHQASYQEQVVVDNRNQADK